jgi:hypothetical protein
MTTHELRQIEHGDLLLPANDRLQHTARGAVALQRREAEAHGDLVYAFTTPWSDGTTGSTLSPLALMEKLAALVPPAAGAPGAVWRLFGAAQPPARRQWVA